MYGNTGIFIYYNLLEILFLFLVPNIASPLSIIVLNFPHRLSEIKLKRKKSSQVSYVGFLLPKLFCPFVREKKMFQKT